MGFSLTLFILLYRLAEARSSKSLKRIAGYLRRDPARHLPSLEISQTANLPSWPYKSPEHVCNRLLLDVGVQVPLPATLLVGLMADEVIDDSLVDALARHY
jgi:hypothetical protein